MKIFGKEISLKNNLPVLFQRQDLTPTMQRTNNLDVSTYIVPIQLSRIKQDISTWRSALVDEMENVWYPQRVAAQKMYWDVVLDGHVRACMNRRINLTMLRDYRFMNKDGTVNEEWTQYFRGGWFYQYLKYCIESEFFGYSLIVIKEIKNNCPVFKLVKRQNIFLGKPNDTGPVVTTIPYQISGIPFLEGEFEPYSLWIPSPTDIGNSDVGYGLLYSVAPYAIFMRNLLGPSATYVEVYGQPIRQIKTNKTQNDPEYASLYKMAKDMGANAFFISDSNDELILHVPSTAGSKASPHAMFEDRMKKFISGIILGHEDAITTPAGSKLSQGNENSPGQIALSEIQSVDQIFCMPFVNDLLIPKLQKLGVQIPFGGYIEPSDDDEKLEGQKKRNDINLIFMNMAASAKNAGLKVSAADASEATGLMIEDGPAPVPYDPGFNQDIKNKLESLYLD